MIVDIGGGTTEIAVIALSGIVCDQSSVLLASIYQRYSGLYAQTAQPTDR